MTIMRTGKIVGGVLICHRMDTVEMKAFHMMENREDAAVARATVGMIMMAKSKEGVGLFKKKTVTKAYDKENKKPVIKASICNGEQVAGFKNIHTGKIEEVMLIKNQADLDAFKKMYGIDGEIEKEY